MKKKSKKGERNAKKLSSIPTATTDNRCSRCGEPKGGTPGVERVADNITIPCRTHYDE